MVKKILSIFVTACILIVSLLTRSIPSFGQTPTPTTPTPTPDNSQAIQNLEQQIQDLQNKISDLQGQEKTLTSQIVVFDSQIQLTQLRINATQQKIMSLTLDISTATQKIASLQNSINNLTAILLSKIVATYEVGSIEPFQTLLSSSDVSNFFKRESYLKIAQNHDKRLAYNTFQAKNDYSNLKQVYEDEKKQVEELKIQLQSYTDELNQEKSAKKQLLADTQGSEANYQSLLAQAQAQLAGFSGFASSQGGASLLSNQTVCDDWGCYYNQRDSQWGSLALNNTKYSIASDGCLLTSMAMVYTHYGHKSVTPIAINSNPSNFASYYPAFLNKTIVADGAQSSRVSSYIDSTLSSGNPVVVGMRYSNGDTHFVVLVSGSGGNYIMNDPFVPNGHKISFSDHYSTGMIYEVDKVTF